MKENFVSNRDFQPVGERDFEAKPIPPQRKLVADILREGKKKHHVNSYHGVDITDAKDILRQYSLKTGEKLSFTAFMIKCVTQAVFEHKRVQSLVKGIWRQQLITYNSVDVASFIERDLGNGESTPDIYIVRNAHSKSIAEISREIRATQKPPMQDVGKKGEKSGNKSQILAALPSPIRKIVWWVLMHSPKLFKRHFGTVVVSSVGMFQSDFSHGVGTTIWPFALIVGGTGKQPKVVQKGTNVKIEVRDVLGITTCIDHIIIDGAPAARFVDRMIELITSGYEINLPVADSSSLKMADPGLQPVQSKTA